MWHFTSGDEEPIAYFGNAIKRRDERQQLAVSIKTDAGKLSEAHVYVTRTNILDGYQTHIHYQLQVVAPDRCVIGRVFLQQYNSKHELEDTPMHSREMFTSDWKMMFDLMTTSRGEPCIIDGKECLAPPIPDEVRSYWREAHQICFKKSRKVR